MPAASETLPALEQRLAERLLAFERLDEVAQGMHRHRVGRDRSATRDTTELRGLSESLLFGFAHQLFGHAFGEVFVEPV